MKIPLSTRLLACCSFVNPGDVVADIGCDHGYLGIYLLQSGIAREILAADVREQPLQSAIRNAEKYGFREKMHFFLSDGVRNIPREFDTLVCAGMGADTMISILEAAPWLKNPRYRLILQCQSKRPLLREYLSRQGYGILRETLAQDGKFIYPVMEVQFGKGSPLTAAQCHLTPALEESGSPLLPAFLDHVISGLKKSLPGLSRGDAAAYQSCLHTLQILEEKRAQL